MRIFGEAVAYLLSQLQKKSRSSKYQLQKNSTFQQLVAKKARILPFFGEAVAYLLNQLQKVAYFKISTAKKFYISTTSREKSANFADFRRSNCIFTQTVAKKRVVQNINFKKILHFSN